MAINDTPTSSFNLLVTGHRDNRLPTANTDALRRIFESLNIALESAQVALNGQSIQLRLILGDSDGTDVQALDIARFKRIPFDLLALTPPPPSILGENGHMVSIGNLSADPQKWCATINEAKLELADALLVVWDGKPRMGDDGGTVRMVIEMLLRRLPVIWVDASPGRNAGTIRFANPTISPLPTLTLLDADERQIAELSQHCFGDDTASGVPAISTPAAFTDQLAEYLAPHSRLGLQSALALVKQWDPVNSVVWDGFLHSLLLRFFGYRKRHGPGKIEAWRGPDEFVLGTKLSAGTWEWFDRLDRAAIRAGFAHYDNVVLVHLLASLAVFGAGAGSIELFGTASFWGAFELATLLAIGWIVFRDRKTNRANDGMTTHKAWLALRQGAEAFRVQALLRPFLAGLPAMYRNQWRIIEERPTNPFTRLAVQSIRAEGIPASNYVIEDEWSNLKKILCALITDQRRYQENTSWRCRNTQHRLHATTQAIFLFVFLTVLVHVISLASHALEHRGVELPQLLMNAVQWLHEQDWLLLVTAFGPAFAAALHGISGKLEMERIARTADDMAKRLVILETALNKVPEHDALALRALAIKTAAAMYAEHDGWANLMCVQELDIPA